MDRLHQISTFAVAIIPRPIEEVLPFYRGYYHSIRELKMLRGPNAATANIVNLVDRATCSAGRSDVVFGFERLLCPLSRPDFTVIEGPHQEAGIVVTEDELADFLGTRYFRFRSVICSGGGCEPIGPAATNSEPEFLHEIIVGGEVDRMVSAYLDDPHPGKKPSYVFEADGEPMKWENPARYQARRIRDRLNRNIICEYLDNLGIDPERTFLRREVSDAVLFCDSPAGEPLDPYVEDRRRYEAFAAERGWPD